MNNPFKRIRDFFRKPAMIGSAPSERPMWHDPAEHACDFAERYAEPMNYQVENRMMELGIPTDRIGARKYGYLHRAFLAGGDDWRRQCARQTAHGGFGCVQDRFGGQPPGIGVGLGKIVALR